MIETLRDIVVRQVFGGGVQGSLAAKGVDWLTDETRSAIRGEPESLDKVRLRPGETFTVIARPPASRKERKLADRVDSLEASEAKLSRATKRQKRTARALAKAQRKLDRRKPGTRRHRRAAAAEAKLARRFDVVMEPSKKLSRVRSELRSARTELDRSRAASLRAARASRNGGELSNGHRRTEASSVYR